MYRNIVLTLLLVATTIVAIELARVPKAAPVIATPISSDRDRAIFERRIPELKLHDLTVGQSLDEIRRITGIPMAVNWTSLEPLRDRPVDVEFHDVALGDAIQFLLCLDHEDSAFFPMPQAEFDGVDGTLIIGSSLGGASKTFPNTAMTLRNYDVRDLLTDDYWGYETPTGPTARDQSRLAALTDAVQRFVGMKNWQMGPGSHGQNESSGDATISYFGGRLFVIQTAYGHMRVQSFLAQLREASRPAGNILK